MDGRTKDPRAAPGPEIRKADGDSSFFGHPRGLGYLAVFEGCVGFSYYGMQSLLVLYMSFVLSRPEGGGAILGFAPFRALVQGLYGPVQGPALASAIMGVYAALVYATPILGGLLADRVLGRFRTVLLGALLMTLGHFLMAFEASFLLALLALVLGSGCAGTVKAQVGELYRVSDLRRADAFQIYIIALSLAVIVAPLVCGTLGERVKFSAGFTAAGAGMLVGLVLYIFARRSLPEDSRSAAGLPPPPLSRKDLRITVLLIALLPVFALASVGNMEIFNGYLLWGDAHLAHTLFGFNLPISWLLSLDAAVSAVTIALSLVFWRWWRLRRREPDEIVKVALGSVISAFAPLVLAGAAWQAQGGVRVSLLWALGFHVVNDIGFANVYAIGIALYSRAAPRSLGATLVNAYSLSYFLCNLLVGYLAGLLGRMPGPEFWLLHSALIAAAALLFIVFARAFGRELAPGDRAADLTRVPA